MNVPNEKNIGDTWEWTESLASYPASTWTLTFYFVNSTTAFNFAATASGNDHAISVAAATTGAYTAGRYQWTARVTDGSDVFTVGAGWMQVKPDPTTAHDARSQTRIIYDAVLATLQGRATNGDQAVQINGRSISRIPISELRQWQEQLAEEVRVEEESESTGLGRAVKVRLQRV